MWRANDLNDTDVAEYAGCVTGDTCKSLPDNKVRNGIPSSQSKQRSDEMSERRKWLLVFIIVAQS
jgi:hypothetical protein